MIILPEFRVKDNQGCYTSKRSENFGAKWRYMTNFFKFGAIWRFILFFSDFFYKFTYSRVEALKKYVRM